MEECCLPTTPYPEEHSKLQSIAEPVHTEPEPVVVPVKEEPYKPSQEEIDKTMAWLNA